MSEDTTTTDWREGLPEGFADAPFIKAAESPEAALAEIKGAAEYMGNSIRIPGVDAGEEAQAQFIEKIMEKAPNLMLKPNEDNIQDVYRMLGQPGEANEYSFEPPEGREVPEDFSQFASVAHKYGLNQKQFQGILGEILGPQWSAMDEANAQHEAEMKGLKTEWGKAYEDNMTQVKNFLRLSDAPEGIVELIAEGAMSAKEIQWLHSVATATKESNELAETQHSAPAIMTPSEAAAKISEILNNPEHPYWDPMSPDHQRAIARMVELHKFKNPEAA